MKKYTEENLQSDAAIWFNNNFCLKQHNPRYVLFLVPNEIASLTGSVMKLNGVKSNIISKVVSMVTQRMKNTGFMGGVSDNIILAPNGKTYFIEFKLQNNYQQDNQKYFEKRVNDLGHVYKVVKSLEEFKEFVNNTIIS